MTENQTPPPASPAGEEERNGLLTFRCGGQRYAVDIIAVREIRSWSAPTPLPHAPAYMRGMVNLRGSVLPVMDLAQRLGLPPTRDDPRNVIIVIEEKGRVHGLLVDAVSDIVQPRADQLQEVPRVGGDEEAAMAERLFVVDDVMIQVLATGRVLPELRSALAEPRGSIPLDPRQHRRLAAIAETAAGLHLPEGKRSFMASRLQRRLRANGLADFEAYVALLDGGAEDGPREVQALISALTTNVTEAFREAHHFALLAHHLAGAFLPPSAGAPSRPRPGRHADRYLIWSAGCSTGEEPLSIAAVCHAVLGESWARHVRILATDVDAAVLDAARDRSDDATLAARLRQLPPGIAARARARPANAAAWMRALHAGITVIRHNLLHALDLPGQFDAIFCRNVSIYFARRTQERVHARLLGRLADDGLLALGHSERLCGADPGLVPIGRTAFRRVAPQAVADAKGAAACC